MIIKLEIKLEQLTRKRETKSEILRERREEPVGKTTNISLHGDGKHGHVAISEAII